MEPTAEAIVSLPHLFLPIISENGTTRTLLPQPEISNFCILSLFHLLHSISSVSVHAESGTVSRQCYACISG